MKSYPEPVDGLDVSVDGGIVGVSINRPDRRNALTDPIVQALIDIMDAAGSDDDARVITLRGSGDHFCSGFDLAGRVKPETPPRTGETQRRMRWQVNELISAMTRTQVPVVVAARGAAMGLGLGLVLASDFAVVADDARLAAPMVRSGFTPDSGIAWLAPRLIGLARSKDLLMLGREITGARAAEWGMVHASAAAGEVDGIADALASELASSATVAVGLAKSLIHGSLTVDLERHLADEAMAIELSSRSADFKEASRARREQRDPGFTGR